MYRLLNVSLNINSLVLKIKWFNNNVLSICNFEFGVYSGFTLLLPAGKSYSAADPNESLHLLLSPNLTILDKNFTMNLIQTNE